MTPKVGQTIQFMTCDSEPAMPAQVLRTHGDPANCVCLVAWCPTTKVYVEKTNIPHCTDANKKSPHWNCLEEV